MTFGGSQIAHTGSREDWLKMDTEACLGEEWPVPVPLTDGFLKLGAFWTIVPELHAIEEGILREWWGVLSGDIFSFRH